MVSIVGQSQPGSDPTQPASQDPGTSGLFDAKPDGRFRYFLCGLDGGGAGFFLNADRKSQ